MMVVGLIVIQCLLLTCAREQRPTVLGTESSGQPTTDEVVTMLWTFLMARATGATNDNYKVILLPPFADRKGDQGSAPNPRRDRLAYPGLSLDEIGIDRLQMVSEMLPEARMNKRNSVPTMAAECDEQTNNTN